MLLPRERALLRIGYFLAVFVIAAHSYAAQITSYEPSNLAITGTVYLNRENKPAQGVMVVVKSLPNGPSVRVLTDENGTFKVERLQPGVYQLCAEEAGYESTRVTVRSDAEPAALKMYLKASPGPPLDRTGNVISVRELKIPKKAMAAFQKGTRCLEKRNPAASLSHFQKAVAAFPSFYEAYYSLGIANLWLYRDDEARVALQKSIDLSNGQYVLAEFGMGVLLWETHKSAEAEVVLRSALERDPNYAKGYLYLSAVLYELGRLEEAEANAREAQHRKPDFAPVYLVLSNIHGRRGSSREQIQDLETYLQLQPPDSNLELVRHTYKTLQKNLVQEQSTGQR